MFQDTTLSFGPFKFDPQRGRLTKHGYRIKLQPKAGAALCCLLEQPGEVVSREQLQTRLWPEGTYVDFQLGIKVAVKKLRDALGDASEEPEYVQTVPGEGYRFIARVEFMTTAYPNAEGESLGTQSVESFVPGQSPPAASIPNRRRILWAGAATAVAAVAILTFLTRGAPSAPVDFRNRDWIVIAAFENRTGEKLLDGSMEYALERALSQSRYVNMIPRDRVNDTLTLMRQSPTAVLTEDLARQVAIRDGGIKTVLAGRVEKFDRKYVLTVRLLLPASGATVALFEKEASRDQLPAAAHWVSDKLRRKLGEPGVDSGAGQASSLEKATTPSLAALRAFSAGMENLNRGECGRAAALLEEAIQEDPQFASAHIYAAHCYSNLKQDDKAGPHYQAAFQLAPGVTQRERLFILGSYYERFLHDDGQAVATYQALVGLYPDDFWGVNNLLNLYGNLNMFKETMEMAERQVALRPNGNVPFAVDLLWYYYRFTRPDKIKAQQYRDHLRRLRNGGELSLRNLANVDSQLDLEVAVNQWSHGDIKSAAGEVARVSASAMNHNDNIYRYWIAMANLTLGKVGSARQLCGQLTDSMSRANCFLRMAYVCGDRNMVHQQLSELRGSNRVGGVRDDRGKVAMLLWLGEITRAKQVSQPGTQEGHTANGLILLAQGRFDDAEKELVAGSTSPLFPSYHGPVFWNLRALAVVLERQGKLDEAIARLESLPNPDPDLRTGWTWPLARTELAALYRKAGRPDDARKVEDELRHYLSEADPEFPLLARLQNNPAATSK